MAEPPDQMPAAGRGHLRASHADRERVVGILKAAFVQGRFTKGEFDLRVSQAFAARTYAELAALTADLPLCPPAAGPVRPLAPVRRRPLARAAAKSGGCLVIAAAATWACLLLVSGDGHYHGIPGANPPYESWAFLPFILAAVAVFTAIGILGSAVATSVEQRRSQRQLPPGRVPGAGGQAPRRLPSADPGRQPPPIDPGSQHTEAARSRRPRPALPGSRPLRRWRTRGLLAGQRPAATGAP
jgi:DUF1707 SHOCT-like domain